MAHINNDIKLDFKDVLIQPKRSTIQSRADVDLTVQYEFLHSKKTYNGIPVMAANMDNIGTFEMAIQLSKFNLFTTVNKYYTIDEWKTFANDNAGILKNVAVTAGMARDDLKRLREIIAVVPALDFICLDVANGYLQQFVEFVRLVRTEFPDKIIIAGDVATGEMVEELLLNGVDIVKCGIGSGSVCTTRLKTGVGYPQLSCIIECAVAAHRLGGHIISDGGCTSSGDVCKALAAGADFVMLGGMFGGHDESGIGSIVERNGRQYKILYGTSSKMAMEKHGNLTEYRASEGKAVEIPYRGSIINTVQDILGGIRSCCTYVGAGKLKELNRCSTFIRVNQQVNEIFSFNTVQQ